MATNKRRINRGWQYAAVIAALLHMCLCIAAAMFEQSGRLEQIVTLVDLPFSIVLIIVGWNSPHLLIWFGVLGTLWWYFLVYMAAIVFGQVSIVKVVPPQRRKLIWRTIGALWTLTCILVLVRTLLLRGGPQEAFRNARMNESLIMSILTFPSSFLLFWAHGLDWFIAAGESLTDLGQVITIWVLYFVIGVLQWFVLVPFVTRRVIDLYRRRAGGAGGPS